MEHKRKKQSLHSLMKYWIEGFFYQGLSYTIRVGGNYEICNSFGCG